LDTHTKNRHAARDNAGRNILGNVQATLRNRFAMPEVAICSDNIVLLALSQGILFKDEWLEYPPEFFIQHLSGCLPLLVPLLQRNIPVLDWNRKGSDHYEAVP
jgi:hypothetical protein